MKALTKTLEIKLVSETEAELLPWMFGWYLNPDGKFGKPSFDKLKSDASAYEIPDCLREDLDQFLKNLSEKNYETGKLIVEVETELLTEDFQKVGDNLCLTNPSYEYKKPMFHDDAIGVMSKYTETFNAGNGRVTAGRIDKKYYKIISFGKMKWFEEP